MTGPVVFMPDGAIKRQGDSLAPQGVVFQAVRTAAGAVAINATVPFVKTVDPFGWYDNATSRFTPKIAGFYRLASMLHYNSAAGFTGTYVETVIRKNGLEM